MAIIDPSEIIIRTIEERDNIEISHVIHTVLEEYGANREGFAGADWATDHMFEAYSGERSFYLVIEYRKKVYGGGGIAALEGESQDWCELQKMYFLPELRGLGLSKRILNRCLDEALHLGYSKMYLETLKNMQIAQKLYFNKGFESINHPMGKTGHFGCDVWMQRTIEDF